MTTDLVLGPDASHHQGHITTWPQILADPAVGFAWCKVSQGAGFTDPEAAHNLAALKAAADRGDIDWYGGYLWPAFGPVAPQVARFKTVVAPYADDPRFQCRIDCEGGGVAELDAIAAELATAYGPERGGVYGGSYLIGPVGNPGPAKAPHAAAVCRAGCSFRAAYVNDQPGHGKNTIPALYVGAGPTYWQFTNGISGPSDQARFPRRLAGGWHGDISCFWQPTAGCTYAEWLAKTIPGGDDVDQPTFDRMLAESLHLSDHNSVLARADWQRGFEDGYHGGKKVSTSAAYVQGYADGQEAKAKGGSGVPDHEHSQPDKTGGVTQ